MLLKLFQRERNVSKLIPCIITLTQNQQRPQKKKKKKKRKLQANIPGEHRRKFLQQHIIKEKSTVK